MDIRDASEIIVGKVLLGEIKAASVEAAVLASPYDDVMTALKKTKASETDLTVEFGASIVAACKQAARAVASVDADWLEVARRTSLMFEVGDQVEKAGKLLKAGNQIDDIAIVTEIGRLRRGENLVTPASEVTPELDHFQKMYWPPLDLSIGGLPKSGMSIIAALPKSGKTTLLCLWAILAARQKKYSLLFSFEQKKNEIVGRLIELGAKKSELKYILLVDTIMSIDGVASLSARYANDYDLHFIGLDFAHLAVQGRVDEPGMTEVYKGGANIAHDLSIPFVMLAQFNDGAYKTGIPRVDHVAWSRMAIAFASFIGLITNPNNIWTSPSEDQRLPVFPGDAYLIVGASRHGFGKYSRVGAIRTDWKPETGWGVKLKAWHDLGDQY